MTEKRRAYQPRIVGDVSCTRLNSRNFSANPPSGALTSVGATPVACRAALQTRAPRRGAGGAWSLGDSTHWSVSRTSVVIAQQFSNLFPGEIQRPYLRPTERLKEQILGPSGFLVLDISRPSYSTREAGGLSMVGVGSRIPKRRGCERLLLVSGRAVVWQSVTTEFVRPFPQARLSASF
jgi:hypothetical protein